MDETIKFWRIVRWADKYEVSQSRSIDKLSWVPVPINLNSNGYLEMMEKENGISLFGCWMAIVQVVARCDLRGSWIKSNYQPHSIRSLSIATRIDKDIVEEVINLTLQIGWIEEIEMPLHDLIQSIELVRDYRKLNKEQRKSYGNKNPMDLWNLRFKTNTDSYHPSGRQVCPKERRREEKRRKENKEPLVNPLDLPKPKNEAFLASCKKGFESWWELYDKKTHKKDALVKWLKLSVDDMKKALEVVEDYTRANEKEFRKDPHRYLAKKTFNDEIIVKGKKESQGIKNLKAIFEAEAQRDSKIIELSNGVSYALG